MEIAQILNIALPVVYVLVGIALVWLLFELVVTMRRTRKTIKNVEKQLEPTLKNVENITASANQMMDDLNPTIAKVDPLVERVALTVDAANLELMRVDKILEDVGEITDTVSSTAQTVDAVTSAPLDLINKVSSGVRNAFKPHRASEESIGLGEKKGDENADEKQTHSAEVTASIKSESPKDPNVPASDEGASAQEDKQASEVDKKPEQPKYFTYSYAENSDNVN